MEQSDSYKGDWIGLKTLNTAGKISMLSYAGAHVQFPESWWNSEILPLFDN